MAAASEGITEYARVLCASAGTSPTPRSPKRELPPASHGVARVDAHQGGAGFQGPVSRHGPVAITGLGEGRVVHRLNHSLLGGALAPPLQGHSHLPEGPLHELPHRVLLPGDYIIATGEQHSVR